VQATDKVGTGTAILQEGQQVDVEKVGKPVQTGKEL